MRDGQAGRGRLATALAVLAVSFVATPAGAACAAHRPMADGWTRIPGPGATGGPAGLHTFDVSDVSTDAIVVTDSRSITSSADGGCTWRVARLPAEVALPDVAGDPGQVTGPRLWTVRFGAGSRTFVWALGQADSVTRGDVGAQPRVYFSADGGVTFEQRTTGLPQFGRAVAIQPLGEYGALLLVRTSIPATRYEIYSVNSSNGWTRVLGDLPVLDDFVVDFVSTPGGLPRIWAWSALGVYEGGFGRPLTRVPSVSGNVQAVTAAYRPGGGEITVFLKHAAERFVSRDGGRTFVSQPGPEGIYSVSGVPFLPGVHALGTTDANVLVEAPVLPKGADYSPDAANVSEPQWVPQRYAAGLPLFARDGFDLYLRFVPLDFPPPPPPPPVDVEIEPPPVKPPTYGIEPRGAVVRLRQGERRVVDYRLDLPPAPTPLDVFFMTDSTGSMGTTISSVQDGVQDIVNGLAAAGINLWFGVADFRDHPPQPDSRTYPYQRLRAIGPLDEELEEALGGISTGGGSTDGHDSGLEAIYQAVTGAGRTDPLLVRGELIPPGKGANFRPDAMKVVLIATDDNFRHPGPANPGYPGPDIDTVSKALVDAGVHLVGLEVDTNSGSAREDMERLAADSGAVAPPEGVDCDGDDLPDVEGGKPIVCDFDPQANGSVADAFVAMLAGIKDFAAVDIEVDAPAPFVTPIGPLRHPDVNVKAPNTFRLPVEFRCTADNAGTRTPVRISARSRGHELAATTATLVCAPPAGPPQTDPAPLPPELVAPVLPPPAAPAAPGGQQQPPPQSNPNPNPQLNANSGFAAQEDEEFSLAVANDGGVVPDDEFAMSGLDPALPPLPALAWAVAFGMTGAAAYGLHLSRRARTAPARAFWERR